MKYTVSCIEIPAIVNTWQTMKILLLLLWAISLSSCPYDEVTLHGNLSGTVTDAETSLPVEDAVIKLFYTNDTLNADTTGMDGSFLFRNLRPQEYGIEVSKGLYEKRTESVTVVTESDLEFDIEISGIPFPVFSSTYLNFGWDSTHMSFDISNQGAGVLQYELTAHQEWIQLESAGGELTTEKDPIEVTIEREALSELVSHHGTIGVRSYIGDDPQLDTIHIYVYYVMDQDSILYKTVKIGTQTWMAENLNRGLMVDAPADVPTLNNGIIEKLCYGNVASNCNIYGGLYMWDEMMDYQSSDDGLIGITQGICPAGWHIPTDKEWLTLETFLGGAAIAGEKLKDSTLWQGRILNVTNESGFSALPGGGYYSRPIDETSDYYWIGNKAYFWSSYKDSGDWWWLVRIEHTSTDLFAFAMPPSYDPSAVSVRCVKDLP